MVLKVKQTVERWVPYRNTFYKLKTQKSQVEIARYFHNIVPSVSASPASTFTSSGFSTPATPEAARPTTPLPSPHHPTQHEDKEGGDLYDDSLPLNE